MSTKLFIRPDHSWFLGLQIGDEVYEYVRGGYYAKKGPPTCGTALSTPDAVRNGMIAWQQNAATGVIVPPPIEFL